MKRPVLAYIPIDRRHALAAGAELPHHTTGAALFADISGFTPLTEALAQELGPRRGAEELTVHLNRVYDALIAELHRFGGSVIGFSGDAITCWLDGAAASARAAACALAMQAAMVQFAAVATHSERVVSLGMKAAVASGHVRRFQVGDPVYRVVDVLAGKTVERLAAAEHQAERGDLVVDEATAAALGDAATIDAWRVDAATGDRFALVSALQMDMALAPWPALDEAMLSAESIAAWLLPPVFQRLNRGQGEFLAELRPAVALFLRFSGIEYEQDAGAPQKLDQFVRQVQAILARYEGSLIQLTIGDKGSYLYAAFGAPIAHEDDAVRAASAALAFNELAAEIDYLDDLQIGVTMGRMRTGAYGSATRRTYGVLGDATNLAARLMSAARPGQILASDAVKEATGDAFAWERLPDVWVKGKSEPIAVARLRGLKRHVESAECLTAAQHTFHRISNQEGVGRTLHILGTLAAQQGQLEVANSRYQRSLALRRALGDRENEANLLNNLGIVARYLGEPEAARRFQEESLAIHEEMGNRWSIGAQLNNLGHAAIDRGEYAYARERLERALLIWQEIGERWATANTIHNLANVARDEGRLTRALDRYDDAVRRWRALDDQWGLAYWLEDVALLHAAEGAARRALALIAAADVVRESINVPRPPAYAEQLEVQLAAVREQFSAEARAAITATGRAMSLSQAIEHALADG